MAVIPPTLPQNYFPVFESYWLQLDGSNNGEVNAITAAGFLKKSQLDDKILHKIWDLSDPSGKGYLDKQGFFTALRLVSVCQCGREPAIKNIMATDPPPKFIGLERGVWSIEGNERTMYNTGFERLQPVNGLLSGEKVKPYLMSSQLPLDVLGKIWNFADMDRDGNLDADEFAVAMKLISLCKKGEVLPLTLPMSLIPATKASKLGLAPPTGLTTVTPRAPSPIVPGKSSSDWVVTPDIKAKYDTYFEGIDHDHDGIVNGDQAKGLFMASGLPGNVLAHVWSLCDVDNTGQLNKEQFALAMYLISEKVKGKREIPGELSPSMIPPSKRAGTKPSSSSGSMGGAQAASTSVQSVGSFDSLSSGILSPSPSSSTSVLHPTPSTGIKGHTSSTMPLLPQSSSSLTSIGPTPGSATMLNPVPSGTPPLMGGGGVLQPMSTGGSVPQLMPGGGANFPADFSAIKELDTISTEIDDIKKEKQQVHQDLLVKQELLVKGREEVKSLHGDLQETQREREQLERQKQEVQAQLEEIENQKSKMEGEVRDIKQKFQAEKEEIDRLQAQLKVEEASKTQQQQELKRLQQQLQDMQSEEHQLKEKVELTRTELQKMRSESQTVQQKYDHVQTQLEQYRKEEQQLSGSLGSLGPPPGVQNTIPELPSDLNIPSFGESDAVSARATAGSCSPVSSISGFSTTSHIEDHNEERDRTDTLTSAAIPDPFSSFPDPFGGNAFSTSSGTSTSSSFDPFSAFKTTPTSSSSNGLGFASFPPPTSTTASKPQPTTTSGMDAFASFTTTTTPSNRPGSGGGTGGGANVDPFGSSDPFGTDPFSSVITPKATTQTPFGGSSPFSSSDPFSSQATPSSDPFASNDPFGIGGGGGGSDPFGGNPFGSSSGFSLDPFATMTDTSKK